MTADERLQFGSNLPQIIIFLLALNPAQVTKKVFRIFKDKYAPPVDRSFHLLTALAPLGRRPGLHHRDQNHEGGVMKHLLVLLAVALVAVILLRSEAPAQPEELTLADVFSRIKTLEAKMDRLVELQLDLESKPNIKDRAKYKRRLLDSFRRDISSLNMKSKLNMKRLLEGGSN